MNNVIKRWFYLLILFPLLFACNESETWVNHYEQTSFERTDLRIADWIKDQEDLSVFAQMLELTGFDDILNASETYTIWVPVNDALSGVDLNNMEEVTDIVRNHIARFAISTSGIDYKRIFMLGRKFVPFRTSAGAASFGNANLINDRFNLLANNGIIHVIDDYVPYVYNIYEFINNNEGLDSLNEYIKLNDVLVFSPSLSTVITYTEEGEPIYDSVFVNTNLLLDRVGELDNEDSLYTALLPTNSSWETTQDIIKEYYKVLPEEGGESKQSKYAKNIIVDNLIFRNQIFQPDSYDSLFTSTGNKIYNVGNLFESAEYHELSNGLAYVTDTLKYKPEEVFYKEIRIEAEESETRTLYQSSVSQLSSVGTGYNLSNNKYILVSPTTARNITGVIFNIPNTLSAKYKIYCVFAPLSITGSNDTTTATLQFALYYKDDKKTTPVVVGGSDYVTNPNDTTKMFVTDFEFPYSNIIDVDEDETIEENTTVSLWVVNMNTSETTTKSRRMCIDCIILEPVIE